MAELVASVEQIVDKARTSWLKNSEVLELLEGYAAAGLSVCQEPPVRPEGGQLFLFDRRVCRFFRRDGHTWRKKPDGKTIRETHEKLKVGNADTLNCYYAHADQEDGLQRRCYWQLDPELEHTVLVHYLCCASSRAGPATQSSSAELAAEAAAAAAAAAAPRPQRASRQQQRRAYSPPPSATRRAGGRFTNQSKLSPLTTQSSLDSSSLSLLSQVSSGEASLSMGMSLGGGLSMGSMQLAGNMPLLQGMTLEAAAALPSLAQQFALQQMAQQQATAAGLGGPAAALGDGFHLDPFAPPLAGEAPRPHPGVLYTDQRVASQLAAAQQQAVVSIAPPRQLFQQESFSGEQHRALFREMSLGIQREAAEEGGGFFTLSPTERSLDPMAGGAPAAAAANTPAAASGAAGGRPAASGGGSGAGTPGGTPGADLAALLASPPQARHSRTFSRQGSGLSRLISKNWESDLQMDMMLPDVDADISAYPVGNGVVIEVAERPTSPSSRLVDHAGITFFGSAGVGHGSSQPASAMVHHALEPSPLGAAPLSPSRQAGAAATAAACQPLAGIPLSFASPLQPAPEAASAGTEAVQFAAGEAAATAQRAAVKERPGRTAACGIPRNGSHPHLNHLARRSIGVPGSAEALSAEGQEQLLRRKERFDAAAMAAQEHREEKLAALRTQRAASSEDAEDVLEMIDVPENMQRLSSFLGNRGGSGRGSSARELAAAGAVADLENETRSLLKHMSIDEADALAAVNAATKELEVMPTIHAAGSSDVDIVSGGPSQRDESWSEELGSRNQSVSSLLEAMQMSGTPHAAAAAAAAAMAQAAFDPINAQLQAAMASHAARAAERQAR